MNAPFEPLLRNLMNTGDTDPEETAEWREALLALIGTQGPERARQILDELAIVARQQRTGW
jgi:pyruvate dehydrogenase E1 component